jgi:hypothetical protein
VAELLNSLRVGFSDLPRLIQLVSAILLNAGMTEAAVGDDGAHGHCQAADGLDERAPHIIFGLKLLFSGEAMRRVTG